MGVKTSNNAFSLLATTINSVATSMSVTAGQGVRFPAASVGSGDYFYATLLDVANNIEIVKVTDRSTDTFTVVRGQDGTTARSYNSGSRIELRVTAALLGDLPIRTLQTADYADASVTTVKLGASGVSAGIYGGNGLTPKVTVNSKGQITNITEDTAVVDRQQFDGTSGGSTPTAFTWTKPTKGTYVRIQMWGGGAGGARQAVNATQANGGGGGGYLEKTLLLADLGNPSYSGTVAHGGIGKTAANGAGTSGGTTTFLGYTVGGGEARVAFQQNVAIGAGQGTIAAMGGAPFTTLPGGQSDGLISDQVNASIEILQTAIFSGGAGVQKNTQLAQTITNSGFTVTNGTGQNSIHGGGGGGGKPVAAGAASPGGQSMHGGGGGSSSLFSSGDGAAGQAPAGGGGAGFNAGGNGAAGRVLITVW
jgi:hypothetical protein